MSTKNKINKFLDYLYDDFIKEGFGQPVSYCWYGNSLWESYDISKSKGKEILKNPNSKVIDLIDKFLLTEQELSKLWKVLTNVEKVTGVDINIVEWEYEPIEDIQWSLCFDIFNIKESE